MSYLYVSDQGAVVSINSNRFQVKYKDGMLKSIPAETLEVIELFGNVQLSTQCITECLKRGITVIFYSTNGAYYGRLTSTNHINVHRQKRQVALCEDEEFKLILSKRIISAKIRNQIVVLRRYIRNSNIQEGFDREIKELQYIDSKTVQAKTLEQLMGFEGFAARTYFKVLGKLVVPEFSFERRSKRPPLDPFNSMLSLGYSIIMNEIYGKIEAKGLNPFFGFLHKDREKHPTLASDLMEEWRAVLIDSTVMSLVNGYEIDIEGFYSDEGIPGVYLKKDTFKLYISKLEKKFRTSNKYLSFIDYPVNFRQALDIQINQFVKVIEEGDPELYKPIIIR